MKIELTLTIPEEATEEQKEFINRQLQTYAAHLHRLLWPRVNYKTGTAFLPERPRLRYNDPQQPLGGDRISTEEAVEMAADPELEKLLDEEERIARQAQQYNRYGHLETCMYRTWTRDQNPPCTCFKTEKPRLWTRP